MANNTSNPFLDIRFPEGLDRNEIYKRNEDMSPDGSLQVIIQEDGDAIITIWPAEKRAYASCEFCAYTGGGRSPRVRQAIVDLAEAIRLDNEQFPQG